MVTTMSRFPLPWIGLGIDNFGLERGRHRHPCLVLGRSTVEGRECLGFIGGLLVFVAGQFA